MAGKPQHSTGSTGDDRAARHKGALSRSALPYLIAAVAASAAMAWYFFVFVPTKLDYFVGLRFRTLAVASAHVDNKVENLARALRSVPSTGQNAPRPVGQKAPSPDCSLTALSGQDPRRQYIDRVLPEIQVYAAGRPVTQGLHLLACGIGGTVPWADVVAQAAAASRRDFDDLILAASDGDVVWQRETSTPRVGNLSELLGAEDEQGGLLSLSWRARATTPAAKDDKHLRSTAVLKAVNLAGASSLLLVQAIAVAADGVDLPAEKDAAADERRLYLAGMVSRSGLQQQAMRIPVAWLVLFALPVLLLFLALPFVKLATVTPKERYSFFDMAMMIVATVAAAGLGAIVPFFSASISAEDETLTRFADQIEGKIEKETAQVLSLADTILKEQQRIEAASATSEEWLQACAASGSGLRKLPEGTLDDRKECGLWRALGKSAAPLELDVVIWFDEKGDQIRKWTTKAQVTGPASHRRFDHFRDVSSNNLWTVRSAAEADRRLFTIDPLRAPTTSEMGVVFAMPVNKDGKPDTPAGTRTFFALNVRPQSLVDPVVAPGYGFAIVAPGGKVLFHSEEGLSLEENFFEEVGDAQDVRERAQSGRIARWSGDYHGRPHRFLMRPVRSFANCPWLVVTFQERAPVLEVEVLQQSWTLRLGALNLLLLALIVSGVVVHSRIRHRRTRDMVESMLAESPAGSLRIWLLITLAAIEGAAICATYDPDLHRRLDWLYATFVVVPVAALLVTLLVRRRQAGGGSRSIVTDPTSALHRRLAAAELGLLVLLVGALPAVGFARVVHVVQEVRGAERWLGSVQQQWSARGARVGERVNHPNYTVDTRNRLRGGFAAEVGALDGTVPYAYLTGFGRAPARESGKPPADTSTVVPSDGQRLVRFLLDWNVLSTSDEPSKFSVSRSTGSHEISLAASDGQPVLVTVDVGTESWHWSLLSLLLGLAILSGAIAAVYWARGKLLPPAAVAAQDLKTTLSGVPPEGNAVVLLIGPPRTKKDEAVDRDVREVAGEPPVERIRLLDATLDEGVIKSWVLKVESAIEARTSPAGGKGPVWIHVSNLETQLVDDVSRTHVLHLLERLLQGSGGTPRALVVTTSVDPIAHFEELFSTECRGIYTDSVPEVSLSRSALLLSHFRRCYLQIGPSKKRDTWCRSLWDLWWRYDPAKWKETLRAEVEGFGPLEQIRDDLEAVWKGRAEVPFDELTRELRTRAAAAYELLWTSCTRNEKLVLIQLAQEGFVTAQSWDVVAPLVAKGIIVERPAFTIFNHSFRDYLRNTERRDVIHEWETMEGHGLWVVSGRLIGSSLLAGGMFYLLTQDFSVQSLLPVVSGTGLFGAPLMRTLFARMSGKPEGASA